jgi:hypothetical protein
MCQLREGLLDRGVNLGPLSIVSHSESVIGAGFAIAKVALDGRHPAKAMVSSACFRCLGY